MDRVIYIFFSSTSPSSFPISLKLASMAERKRRTDLRVEVAPSYTKSWGGKWCVVETTGITGNYRNDLLTLETGYLEPHCWYPFAVLGGAASKYSNERCNNRLSRTMVDCPISLAIMGIKKILPHPENQRWLPDE